MNLSSTIEVNNIFLKEGYLKELIKSDFISFKIDQEDALKHTIGHYKINLRLKYPQRLYSLFNKPIMQMYGYLKNNDQFCLYILIEMDSMSDINGLIDLLGMPWNVSEKDYNLGDFDMLLWEKNKYDISLMRHFEEYNQNTKLLRISNIPANELLYSP
ncbi:hypothetical protein HDF23_004569 [Mucilaginibacter lappiensis]|uniref:Uncharacterized protein n=1 Tax=Mucilaginibacter lappiensis TaxID=354630 RepID=A0ABR6PPU4_9SPHI|nr:hypothetical protein [Mucilaginibacter lappiensis]MBB6111797.1 hypothetical protein [Mucilaginibacter lappiensis]